LPCPNLKRVLNRLRSKTVQNKRAPFIQSYHSHLARSRTYESESVLPLLEAKQDGQSRSLHNRFFEVAYLPPSANFNGVQGR